MRYGFNALKLETTNKLKPKQATTIRNLNYNFNNCPPTRNERLRLKYDDDGGEREGVPGEVGG